MTSLTSTVDRQKLGGAKLPATPDVEVIIIGAGPYGLSAAAHLKSQGIAVRIFGEPMNFWAHQMPEGMLLRSPRVASNIADPHSAFTLEAYERTSGTQPAAPVSRETFVAYGRWFPNQLGSDLDRTAVDFLTQEDQLFRVRLHDGAVVRSRRVVIAAGIGPFLRKPAVFANLPADQASHCSEGRRISEFAGKRVAVIGAGQSALESAALLHEAGSTVEVIARIPKVRWIGGLPWLHHLGPISQLLYSHHDVGPAGISRTVSMPNLMYYVPLKLKDKMRIRAVRPAGARWLPNRLAPIKISTGRFVRTAFSIGDEVILKLDDGSVRRVDHVLMGTGYEVNIAKYDFLSPRLAARVQLLNGYPKLARGFESSVPGMHFIGAPAARNFGPLLYFVAGTAFASRELTSRVRKHPRKR